MELVTLTNCWNAFEAEVIKGRLEAEGIMCILQGVGFSRVEIGSGLGNSACSVPILVREEDLELAKTILEETKAN